MGAGMNPKLKLYETIDRIKEKLYNAYQYDRH